MPMAVREGRSGSGSVGPDDAEGLARTTVAI